MLTRLARSSATYRPMGCAGSSTVSTVTMRQRMVPARLGSRRPAMRCGCPRLRRVCSGCVPRLQLESWLQKEARNVLGSVDAGTVLQLLTINTYGKTGKHVVYKSFLDGLEAAVGNVTPLVCGGLGSVAASVQCERNLSLQP